MNRRALLSLGVGCLSATLAGCSGTATKESTERGPATFYVENYTTSDHEFSLTMTDEQAGTNVVDTQSLVSAKHGTVFPAVGEVGRTYHLEIALDGLPPLTRDWTVADCADGGDDSPSRAASFFVREDSRGFAQCGNQRVGNSDELTYVSATG